MKTMENSKKYDVISPDGISIDMGKTYTGLKATLEAFKNWVKRFERQGYYSSVKFGRIYLRDLEDFCEFKPVKN